MSQLDGKVALRTGALGTIGRANAVKPASQRVMIAAHYGSNVKAVTETAQHVAAGGAVS